MRGSPRTGYLLGFTAALAWASTSPLIKYVLDTYHVPALTLAFWRDVFIAGALGLLLAALGQVTRGRYTLRVTRRDLGSLALTGVISVGIYHALWIWSIVLNGAALAVVLIYTYPTFVTIGAWLFFGERISKQQLIALLLAFAGCLLLVRVYDLQVIHVSWLGTLVGLCTGVTHAGYVLASQRAVTRYSPWVTLFYTMFFGAVALLLLASVAQGPRSLGAVNGGMTPWVLLAVLAIGPTLCGYALFTMALRHLPGRIASVLVMIEAPIATLLAVVWLGERVAWPQVIGIGLILSAAVLPVLAARRVTRIAPASPVEQVGI